jgi:hypothetical protein
MKSLIGPQGVPYVRARVKTMPVMKKEIELDDGRKIWVRQASGMERLRITNIQGKAFRKMAHAGSPTDWTDEQNEEFAAMLDDMGGSVEDQIREWVPACILDEDVDINMLTFEELNTILQFVRGDDEEGAVPFSEFLMVAPSLCMAFKGTLPSDLWLKYSVEGGRRLMELDLIIAADINDKIAEVTNKASKKDAKGMVARHELLDILRESGVPFVRADSGEGSDDK